MAGSAPSALLRIFRIAAVNILLLVLLVFLVEGMASCLVILRDIISVPPVAERLHTEYDPDLGWVNMPDVRIPDMYGPGIALSTNGQGIRGSRDFDRAVPEGKTRIVCSGDSFTLGYGVGDESTWCQQLTRIDENIETVNMGQGGYGADQAYLLFKRDIGELEYDVHLMAFITGDFWRMESNQFLGYGKPVLEVQNGDLVTGNVPVPRAEPGNPLLLSLRGAVRRLRVFKVLSEPWGKGQPPPVVPVRNPANDAGTQEIVLKMFEDLKQFNEQRSSQLVLVYLPIEKDLVGYETQDWTEFLETASRTLDVPLINVLEELRNMGIEDTSRLFIPFGQMNYIGAEGHYSEYGNELVAKLIHDGLERHLSRPTPQR